MCLAAKPESMDRQSHYQLERLYIPSASAALRLPILYYKTIIPKNPKKGALTPGSIF